MRKTNYMLGTMLLIGAATASATKAPAPIRICVLDEAAIIKYSKLASNEANHFQQIRQSIQANFNNETSNLDADARALENLRASLPLSVVKSRTEDIARRRAALLAKGNQINRNLADLNSQLTNSVTQAAAPFAQAVSGERGCSMVILRASILYLNDASLDITPAVVERMNAAQVSPAPR